MNLLPPYKRLMVLQCLVDGMSIRATARVCDVDKNTVMKLLREIGPACLAYQKDVLQDLECRHVEVDELWSFIYAKERNKPRVKRKGRTMGDIWTRVAIDRRTKLVPAWRVGDRGEETGYRFMQDLRRRIRGRFQLTSDGHLAYFEAVGRGCGFTVDYAQLVKHLGTDMRVGGARTCKRIEKPRVQGHPDMDAVSTSSFQNPLWHLALFPSMRAISGSFGT